MSAVRMRMGVGFGYCVVAMLTAIVYFQMYLELEACPLCIMQRVVYIGLALLFLIAFLHNPGWLGEKIYAGLVVISALTGAGVSAWHVRLQHLPEDQVPLCGPGLEYMMEVFSFTEMLQQVFQGSGECADVLWQFLGLSIPGWTLVSFLVVVVYGVGILFTKKPVSG